MQRDLSVQSLSFCVRSNYNQANYHPKYNDILSQLIQYRKGRYFSFMSPIFRGFVSDEKNSNTLLLPYVGFKVGKSLELQE